MNDIVVRSEGLGKRYFVGHQVRRERYSTLRDVISSAVKGFARSARDIVRGRQLIAGDEIEEFWALRDINFEIRRGEVAGIIGRNGAGKSTLLKVLSRITEPSLGRVEIRGRAASLLEVGTGFHPELTGRENIYLNGAILGMSRAEIRKKFDEIVAFAEVEKFLDTPVKRYSSGMYVRLAFAVAAHLEPEILIIDEVLAVGDAEFQKKCLGKMQEVAGDGRTVLFVSHNLTAVRNLCSNTLLLDGGKLIFSGSVEQGLAAYEKSFRQSKLQLDNASFGGPLSGDIYFNKIRLKQEGAAVVDTLDPFREVEIEVIGQSPKAYAGFQVKIVMFRHGSHITSFFDVPQLEPLNAGLFCSRFRVPGNTFGSGIYTLGLGAVTSNGRWLWANDIAALEFSEITGGEINDTVFGPIRVPYASDRKQKTPCDVTAAIRENDPVD